MDWPEKFEPGSFSLSRIQQLRNLAAEAFLKIDFREREKRGGVTIEIPLLLEPVSEEDARRMADILHTIRFPGEEAQDSPQAQEASYWVIVWQTQEAETRVGIFFSKEEWERQKKEKEEELLANFLTRTKL